jgi:hypothetical protein
MITVYNRGKSVNLVIKLFENCIRGYIMLRQKGGRPRFGGQEAKEV